ncbi:MAG: HAMP domain-containing protein [Desulfobacterales bacterium]|nr:HAMP domain-containing protein [Desulfobacterales bacterium]
MGYLVSTCIGFVLGGQTESRLHDVSEHLFTASTQSRIALSAFEEQIKLYNDVIMLGKMGNAIESSAKKAEQVQMALQSVAELEGLSRQRLNEVRNTQEQLKKFSDSALATYTKISTDPEYIFERDDEAKDNLEDEIFRLGQQTNQLRDKLTALSENFSNELKAELAAISSVTRYYRFLSMVIFLCNVLILAAVVSFILSKHVLTPIRKLAAGTRALTSLEFGTRIDVGAGDELGQLASDFNVMAKTLKRYEKMRKQWISDISHELRTPLSILRGEIEAMQDGVREITEETLDSLHSETLYLNKIVDDLHQLSLAETEALHFKHEPVNPARVLKETIRLFQHRLNSQQLTIQDNLMWADQNITVLGDADRLTQVFSNLIENTLRYADTPGTLKIWDYQTETGLSLNFEDSGPGVPEESLERLFDRLYRVDKSRSRAKGGSGLGLAICKNIVETQGGEIRAANAPSGGLRIEIVFPAFSKNYS